MHFGPAEAQHRDRHGVPRQPQKLRDRLAVLEDVADVARADAQRLGGEHGSLRRDQRVGARHQEVPGAGGHALRHPRHPVDPGDAEEVHPLLPVGEKDEHPGRPGDERLVVAEDGEPVLERLVGDLDDRVQHLVAGRGRAQRRVEHRRLLLAGGRNGVVGARRAARLDELERGVHGFLHGSEGVEVTSGKRRAAR